MIKDILQRYFLKEMYYPPLRFCPRISTLVSSFQNTFQRYYCVLRGAYKKPKPGFCHLFWGNALVLAAFPNKSSLMVFFNIVLLWILTFNMQTLVWSCCYFRRLANILNVFHLQIIFLISLFGNDPFSDNYPSKIIADIFTDSHCVPWHTWMDGLLSFSWCAWSYRAYT